MELTLDQALQKGIEAHRAGKVQEADQYYTAILKANPKHPDANHNMGVLAVGVGKVQEALPFFKVALDANPKIAQFWLSYIDALIKLDRTADAKLIFEEAKSKGAIGDGFDKLQQRLAGLEKDAEVNVAAMEPQEPTEDQLQSLINLYRQDHHQQALTQALELLKQFSNSINLFNIIGAANQGLGKLDDAIVAYKKALSIKPDYADAHYNMGTVLQDQGKLGEALEAYNKALSIKPDYAKAYINLGNALKEQGKLEKAIEAYNKATSIKPDYADAYNNLGTVLQDQGKLGEAILAYKKALSIKPDYADAYNNLGTVLQDQGKLGEAILAYNKAVSIKPDYAKAYNNIGIALNGINFTKPNKDLQKTIINLLERKISVRPKDIATAAISLLKFEPSLQKHLKLVDTAVIENPLDVISDLSDLPLLPKLMSVCPLPDLELEKLVTKLRYAILSTLSSLKKTSPALIGFQSALALQCFTNEYIYNYTDEEAKDLRALEKKVKDSFKKNEEPSPHWLLALASYKALNQYDWCNLLVVTDDIKDVFTRQVAEPNHEEKLKKQFPILDEITDNISSKVREQYEGSPYPRWVNVGLTIKPLSISNLVDEVNLKLNDNRVTEVEKPNILIAGCGTGQHSIETAARFKPSSVLAIDLSLSSLAYAKRKTNELAVENIEYMQADILDLEKLNKQFDIIESVGVLHHMDDPMAGWKVLTDCLKPGGMIRIGLYSELARQHIVKIRQEISKLGIGSSDTAMKSFRKMVMTSTYNHHKQILNSTDFYSLSTLKDLLFHVQENRFTIPQIKDHLCKLGLHFCGFEQNEIVSHFTQTNNAKEDLYDLDKWQAYEEVNPRSFAGMYQFWCQKID